MGLTELFQPDNTLIHSQLLHVKAGFNTNTLSKTSASRPFPLTWLPETFFFLKGEDFKKSEYRNGK